MGVKLAAYVVLGLMTANGVAVQAGPVAKLQAEAVPEQINDGSDQVEPDLTGYWQQDDGQIFYFEHSGSSLVSRHVKRSARNNENDIDFTATVHGNLIYGAHRGPFSRAMQEKCSNQIWVGMGLTLNDGRNQLAGFRGDRAVDPKNCSAKNADTVALVYTKVADEEGNPFE